MFKVLVTLMVAGGSAWAETVLTVQVVDSSGKPIEGAEVYSVNYYAEPAAELPEGAFGKTNEQGEIQWATQQVDGACTLTTHRTPRLAGVVHRLYAGNLKREPGRTSFP